MFFFFSSYYLFILNARLPAGGECVWWGGGGGGGKLGALASMGYIGMCAPTWHGFQSFWSQMGYSLYKGV